MARIKRSYLESRVQRLAETLDTTLELDYAPQYGGFCINTISNHQLNGYCNRLSAKELDSFIDGILLALDKSYLNKLLRSK